MRECALPFSRFLGGRSSSLAAESTVRATRQDKGVAVVYVPLVAVYGAYRKKSDLRIPGTMNGWPDWGLPKISKSVLSLLRILKTLPVAQLWGLPNQQKSTGNNS